MSWDWLASEFEKWFVWFADVENMNFKTIIP